MLYYFHLGEDLRVGAVARLKVQQTLQVKLFTLPFTCLKVQQTF